MNIRYSRSFSKTGDTAVLCIKYVIIALLKWSEMTKIALIPEAFFTTSRKSKLMHSNGREAMGTDPAKAFRRLKGLFNAQAWHADTKILHLSSKSGK